MAWSDELDIADEHFHRWNDNPYWSENSLLSFNKPERNLCGFIYFYFRPNMNLVVAGPAIWDDTGEDVYNCLYYGWDQHVALPPGTDMFDFALPNSLTCEMVEPQKEYRLGYDRHGVKFDLTWTAYAEPHYMKLTKEGTADPGIVNWVENEEEFSVGHYEQAGRMQGTLDVRGELIEIDSGALRDRGWGVRYADVADPLRAGWPYCFASSQNAWHLYPTQPLPFDEDPIEGTTEHATTGFYIRNGLKAHIVEGTRRAERGRDGRVVRQVVDAVDELGRELHAVGETVTWLKWPINSDILNWWCMVKWEFDGLVAYGDDQDFMTFRHYRKYWSRLLEKDPGLLHCIPTREAR